MTMSVFRETKLHIAAFVALVLVLSQLATCQKNIGRLQTNKLRNVCDRHWEVIYSHDEGGNATFGDKRLLRNMAMTGSYIKAHLYMPDHILQLTADNINKRGDELCFQSLRALAHNGSHVDTEDPLLYFMVCTTGAVTERGTNHTSVFRVAIEWYVKEISSEMEPVYSNFIDGSPVNPDGIVALHEAAKHMNLLGAMRDKPYLFPLHNVVLDPETGEVNGQNVMHMGQTYRDNFVTFHDVPYQWFSYWSNLGGRDNARWSLQGHRAYKHNADTAALDWYADICWRHVYTNDANGFDEFGTVEELIDYINKGHRVRVRVDDMSMEVSNVRVKDNIVAAQLLNEVSRVGGYGQDRYHIESDTRAKFSIVHTTGKVICHEYLVGSTSRKINRPRRRSIEWMVDTRPWRVLLQTSDPPGQVLRGSQFELQEAIMQGASIRLNVVLDPLEGSFFTQANNLRLDMLTNTIYAQAMDHMSDKKSSVPGEYEFQRSLFRWYLLISSEGPVRMTAWNYGSDTFKYDESALQVEVTWYANV
ncbi:uncharacterized protein LOC101853557 [Aplysia californica]|uniref:Uncharacterized protein LOC101853557 n=1 Tax=Aplysia californica TaxID=6500 RepID=A0ABM0JQC9_APLCA|nr:uncharacterized protein LOC101853557 [Aplysia californica]